MKRRHFLSITGLISGSCLIPPSVAKRIREIGTGSSHPAVLGPENPGTLIYAERDYDLDTYTLNLGNPYAEPDYPTLGDFIEMRGYTPDNNTSLKEFFLEYRENELEENEIVTKAHIAQLRKELDEPIDGWARSSWLDLEYEIYDGPMALGFHYFMGLDLSDGQSEDGEQLGEIAFVEGDRPGSNLTYCETYGVGSLAAIQHRLNELGTGARIITQKDEHWGEQWQRQDW